MDEGAHQVGAGPRPSKSILIIDDDVDILETLREILQDEGYQVAVSVNGQEALKHLRSGGALPSLILLDLTMPIMNGWQFREEQRRDSALASIPIVVITAAGGVAEKVKSIAPLGVIQKPFRLNVLLDLIGRCIG